MERRRSLPLYDCFIFNDEFDLLLTRLEILSPIAERFVLVESAHTFRGKPKPLHFARAKALCERADASPLSAKDYRLSRRLRPFIDRITHVEIKDMPDLDDPSQEASWKREAHQRNGMSVGLARCVRDHGSAALMSDVDEIPSPAALDDALKVGAPLPAVLSQRFFYYSLRCEKRKPWLGPVLATVGSAIAEGPQRLRDTRGSMRKVGDGGWHLSYFGSPERISCKIGSFAHQEYDRREFTDPSAIAARMSRGTDCYDRGSDEDMIVHDLMPEGIPEALWAYFPATRGGHIRSVFEGDSVSSGDGPDGGTNREGKDERRDDGVDEVERGEGRGFESACRRECSKAAEGSCPTIRGGCDERSDGSGLARAQMESRSREATVCAIVHLGDPSLWAEMERYLDNLESALVEVGESCDLYVSVGSSR